MIPYGRQNIDIEDIKAVTEVLNSDWLTTGPKLEEFEHQFAKFVGAKYAVAVSSGTAALHAAMFALNIGSGDEVIVPPITFAATANCVVYQGGVPVFADVNANTLLIDCQEVIKKITSRTKAIIAVDYAGQPCDYDELLSISKEYKIPLVSDACHALGAVYKGRPLGSIADLTVFSFHPVKHITTGEGGMITTNNEEYAKRLRIFRNHGITTDHRQREQQGSWFYEMVDLGYNYRISDIQCALGISQLNKLPQFLKRRWEIANSYDEALKNIDGITPIGLRYDVLSSKLVLEQIKTNKSQILATNPIPLSSMCNFCSIHAYHLYVVKIEPHIINKDRQEVFKALRNAGIGVNVHYIPVYLHPFYRKYLGTQHGLCPVSEEVYANILTLPIYYDLLDDELKMIIQTLYKLTKN